MERLDAERQLPLSIIIGDLNGLKQINDTRGHKEGDALLKKAAGILQDICRREDILARWGGDEFLLLLPRTGEDIAQRICERIRAACTRRSDGRLPVSMALGYATREERGQEMRDVFHEADERIYDDKRGMKEDFELPM